MSPSLRVEVAPGDLARARTDLALVPVFAQERPLRGDAGRADWRLCGALSALVRDGIFRGEPGEAALLPCSRRLRAGRVLALGLGERMRVDGRALRDFAAEAVSRSLGLGAGSVAVSLPLDGGALPLRETLSALLAGSVAVLATGDSAFRLRLLVEEARLTEAGKALAVAGGRQQGSPVRLELRRAAPPGGSSGPAGSRPALRGPAAGPPNAP